MRLENKIFLIKFLIFVEVLCMESEFSLAVIHFAVLPVLEDGIEKEIKRVDVVLIRRSCNFG